MTLLAAGTLVTPFVALRPGWIAIEDGRVRELGEGRPAATPDLDLRDHAVAPGFVDVHCHGGGGADYATDGAAAASFHLRNGTTTTFASLVTAPVDVLVEQLGRLHELVAERIVAGIHLEGPFLARRRCGVHDPGLLRNPDRELLDRLIGAAQGSLRTVTLAPELAGGLAAIRRLRDGNIVPAVGHTDATYAQTLEAVEAGAAVGTHLFNGMRPLHHREPGPALALLDSPGVVCELILDGVHVHEALVRHVVRAAGTDRVVFVSDAISAAGMGDGTFELGGRPITVQDGVARLDGGLAGSTLTLARAVQLAVTVLGLPLADAVRMATATPARAFGLDGAGELAPGLPADLVVLGERLDVAGVMRQGRWLVEP
jgi:N-acetylglucosamine-6-phosphate deacetylase